MAMFDAPSDRDHRDDCHGPYGQAVERTCAECGGSVFVSRSEHYVLVVVCDACQGKERQRTQSRAAQRAPQESEQRAS